MRAVALLAFAAGCTVAPPSRDSVPPGDARMFAERVQPVLQRYCAFLACHGRPGIPLFLFAVDFARMPEPGPGVPLRELALSPEEPTRNQRSTAARVDVDVPDDTLLLRKVRSPDDGGEIHATGDVVFRRTAEPDYGVLREWVTTVIAERGR